MAIAFLHHAPSDAGLAEAVVRALEDGEAGSLQPIAAAPGFLEALQIRGAACRAVVDLVTDAWLADPTAFEETRVAWRMGKASTSLVRVDATSLDEAAAHRLERLRRVAPEIALAHSNGRSLDGRARNALFEMLRRVGAQGALGPDPAVFELGVGAAPFRGLASFGDEDADAGLLYGRGRELVELLELLRARRATADRRMLLLAGEAGTGTSSLLAAGLLPRLRREGPAWRVLRLVRPGDDPLGSLARAIAGALAEDGVEPRLAALRDDLRTARAGEPLEARLEALGRELRAASGRPHARVLLALDGCDALVEAGAGDAAALRAILVAAARLPNPWQLVLTTRTSRADAVAAWLEVEAPVGPEPLVERVEVRAIPAFRVDELVILPAARCGRRIDPALAHALIVDLPPRGGLPQLAHALHTLSSGDLTLAAYRRAGGLAGLSASAPASAFPRHVPLPEVRHRRLTRRALVALSALASLAIAMLLLRPPTPRGFRAERIAPYVLDLAAERALRPGAVFRECDEGCPEMIVVPAGSYLMGDEEERDPSLLPRQRITLARPFAVGRTEVTFAEYRVCIDHGPCGEWPAGYRLPDENGAKPAVHLATDRMRAYAGWLSEMTGKRYRLPSSAEWEYVARAGTTTAYFWGDVMRPGRAHCEAGCGSPFAGERVEERGFLVATAPVGSFAPNAFGLYDVHGNVWEVVADCWHESYRGTPTDGSAWREADGGECSGAVVRGGGWSGVPRGLRAASRDWLPPDTVARPMVGFRVVRDLAR
ncbi:MAG: SUMF1/EgtB/PvdO family nonheme iron enzyme [Myxococcota bacterium]